MTIRQWRQWAAWAAGALVATCSAAAVAQDYSLYVQCNDTVLATTGQQAFLPTAPTYTMRIAPVASEGQVYVSGANVQIWRIGCAEGGSSAIAMRIMPDATNPPSDALGLRYFIYQRNAPRFAAQLRSYFSDIAGPTTGTLMFPALSVSSPLPLQIDGDPNDSFTIEVYDWAGRLRGLANIPDAFVNSQAFVPQLGMWWNPAEPGTGYSFDLKHGVLVMTVYSYTSAGEPIWYLASGPMVNNRFTGTVDRYGGGPCLACAFKQSTLRGNDGTIAVTFNSPSTATVVLPGGRTIAIVPYAF